MNKKEKLSYIVLIVLSTQEIVNGELEGFIVNGDDARIREYPHVAYLAVMCHALWTCGSSILNQDIIITAAHCFENCPSDQTTVGIIVGKAEISSAFDRFGTEVKVHEKYDNEAIENDIALIRIDKPLKFSKSVKKIAIERKPNYGLLASIAGWGLIDEDNPKTTQFLQKTEQKIWLRKDCLNFFDGVPKNTICAGYRNENHGYAAVGDSGSGLVVKKYILVGILSYKMPTISSSVSIYTKVSNFYAWVQKNSAKLYCQV